MSRLTRKIDNGYVLPLDEIKVEGYLKAIDKLGKLEDLEEQLGCPLDIIVKLSLEMITEIYTFDKRWDNYNYVEFRFFSNPDGIHSLWLRSDDRYSWELPINEYGKTWWLKEDKSE